MDCNEQGIAMKGSPFKEESPLQKILQKCRSSFYYVGLFSCMVNILMLTAPIYMLQIFDRVFASKSTDTLIYLSIIAIVALAVMGLLDMARSRILIAVSHWLDNSLSPLALDRSADEILMGGSYGAQSLNDTSNLRSFIGANSIFTLFDSPWVPIYLLVVFMLHPMLGIISTIGAVILFAIALINEMVSREPLANAGAQHICNQRKIDSALNNCEAIQAMGMLPSISKTWLKANEEVLNLQDIAGKRSNLLMTISKFIRMTLQLAILGVGAYYVLQGQLTGGSMIAASIIMARALAPVEQSIGVWKQFLSARGAYRRLGLYLATKNPRGDETISLPKPQGLLSLDQVTYLAPGSTTQIIQNISLAVKPGEMLVIIGPSGAGKSTLARLMLGVWKANYGSVRLDSADVYSWDRSSFGQHVGYLPQNVELLAGNVKENIARMSEEIDEQAVIAAAQLAGVHEMILHLPDGYETATGGFELSGGQRQRIGLARAFYGEPCLVVLDEPNANLDQAGNVALEAAIKNARERGITVVVISHQSHVIKHADNLLLLTEGRIQMMGPRDEVLEKLKSTQAA